MSEIEFNTIAPNGIPAGADGTEPQHEACFNRLEFAGMRMHRFAVKGGMVKYVGKREFGGNPVGQIWEIELTRDTQGRRFALVFENGQAVFTLGGMLNASRLEKMALSALRRYLVERTRTNGSTRRKIKRQFVTQADGSEPADELA